MNSLIDEIPVFLSFTSAYISSLLQVLKIDTSNTSEKAFNAFNDLLWIGQEYLTSHALRQVPCDDSVRRQQYA